MLQTLLFGIFPRFCYLFFTMYIRSLSRNPLEYHTSLSNKKFFSYEKLSGIRIGARIWLFFLRSKIRETLSTFSSQLWYIHHNLSVQCQYNHDPYCWTLYQKNNISIRRRKGIVIPTTDIRYGYLLASTLPKPHSLQKNKRVLSDEQEFRIPLIWHNNIQMQHTKTC